MKKTITILLALSMLASFTACSGKTEAKPDSVETTQKPAETTTEPAEPQE